MKRIDPFTMTPGIAGAAYINTHYAETIIENFESEQSSKYVYKIVGLRGSGKSVEYSQVINHFKKAAGWRVYTTFATSDPVESLIAKISSEPFIHSKKHTATVTTGGSAGADAFIAKGNANISLSRTTEDNMRYYSSEVALEKMIREVNEKGYKVLIGIDDISKTPKMVNFLSLFGMMLLDDSIKVYLVCTGLSKNIEDFASESNLSFFKRGDFIETKALNLIDIASMYSKLLEVSTEEAVVMSKFTCGYAFAYQLLGSLYFNKSESETFDDLLPEFDKVIFRDSYALIWPTLTEAEQKLVRIIALSPTGKIADIKNEMEHPDNISVLRARLENKHIINTQRRGYITIDLPRFAEYVRLWQQE